MVCAVCGAPFGAETRFCSRCGTAVTPDQQAPVVGATRPPDPRYASPQYAYAGQTLVPRAPRVVTHVRTLGILWVCFGVWRVLGGLFGMFFLSTLTMHRWGGWGVPYGHFGHEFPQHWMGFLVPFLAMATIVSAGMAFFTGYALLNRKSWGRVFALITGILGLIKFPLGTALGVYTLWVLLPSPSGAEYDHLAATSGS